MKLILNFPQASIPGELGALGVNLSLDSKNAEIMASGKAIGALLARYSYFCRTFIPFSKQCISICRFLSSQDIFLAKMVRNLANWTYELQCNTESSPSKYSGHRLWGPHVGDLLQLLTLQVHSLPPVQKICVVNI